MTAIIDLKDGDLSLSNRRGLKNGFLEKGMCNIFYFLLVTEYHSSRIVYPYPEAKYCDLPPEDMTGKSICCRLPAELKSTTSKGDSSPGAVLATLSLSVRVHISI